MIAFLIVWFSNLDVLSPFQPKDANVVHAAYAQQQPAKDGDAGKEASPERRFIDIFLSVVFISAGTEGFNSLLKWLSYKKEDAKASAAANKGTEDTKTGMKEMPS